MQLKPIAKKAILVLLPILLIGFTAHAQKLVKDYVEKNAVPISTIEPDSTNYTDLEPIGNAIGNAKIVMLGEQDHGDAPTFLAKTRLIKYLHERKGFNVLAFESDFFGLNDGWERLPKRELAIDSFLWQNIFSIWTACKSCTNLFFDYVPSTWKTSSPLTITGFDSQQYLYYSFRHLGKRLDTVLRGFNLPITKRTDYAAAVIPLIDSSKVWTLKPPADISRIDACLHYLQTIRSELATVVKADDFWIYVVDNMIQQVESAKIFTITKKLTGNTRDVRMAINLQWLNDVKFKNEKIIVWAADYHTMRPGTNMKEHFFDVDTTMGDVFAKNEKNGKVYSIGFTSYKGEAGRLNTKPHKVYEPRGNGFETWINQKHDYAFVDFQKFNSQNQNADEYFYMKSLGHLSYFAKWNYVFDGIFFIRNMYPCEPSYAPVWVKPEAKKQP
ncbi:MAG: erythromycin esterase family protein [Sphingobacteriales bacterium]